jgi:hypothetical protein
MTLCCKWGDVEQCETSSLCATQSVSQRRHRQTTPLPWPACSAERGRLEVGSESQGNPNVIPLAAWRGFVRCGVL